MKLSSGKRKLPISAPFPCHRGSVRCHLSHRTHLRHQPNEQPIIIWLTHFNLFTVPYFTLVPLLSSLLLCVGWLSTDAGTSQAGAILNWNYNEFRLSKCAFLSSSTGLSFCLSLCALLSLARRRSTPPDSSKLACHRLLMATLTVIFLLAIVNARPAGAQSPAFLNADSLDSYEHEDEEDNEQTAYPTIRALVNGSVSLPCNISQTKEENSIKLILWYKNSILGTPIYSIDARDTNISQARHFLGPSYTGRASFELNLAARLALLAVNYLSAEDDGHYICRVDFRYSRTTISTVKLDVIVPPRRLRVMQVRQSAAETAIWTNSSSFSGPNGNWAPGPSATKHWNKGTEMHGRSHEHPVRPAASSVLSIVHNGSMINEIATVRQPEETQLTLFCDSIGGRPRSIVKWYRLVQWEQSNFSAVQLYDQVQATEERELNLIDDSFQQLNQTEPEVRLAESAHWKRVLSESRAALVPVTNGGEESPPLSSAAAFVRNELHLGTIEDANHGQLYLCRTSNSNLSKPLDAIVRLQIDTRPKSIQVRQQVSPKDLLRSASSPSWSQLEPGSNSHAEEGTLFRNRTLHSIELLGYYLNAKQSLMMRPFQLKSGFETEFICQSNGSRPAARIVWLLRDYRTAAEKDITQLSSSTVNDHGTVSQLRLVPKFTDNRASLICRACNEALAKKGACQRTGDTSNGRGNSNQWTGLHRDGNGHYGQANKSQTIRLDANAAAVASFFLETSVLLDVQYKPIVSVKILSGEQIYHEVAQSDGKSTALKKKATGQEKGSRQVNGQLALAPAGNYHQFKETQEIFFNCSINANPSVHLVWWFFNGKALHLDLEKGIIITNSNRTMIISSASRANAGEVHCSGTNLLGTSESERHVIAIQFEPQCRVDYTQTSYHQLGDIVQLKCQVFANPVDDLQFAWRFNDTPLVGHLYNIQQLQANVSGNIYLDIDDEKHQVSGNFGSPDQGPSASKVAVVGDKLASQANLPQASRTTTHSSSQQAHLITNVVRIELKKWSSFGHFSCTSRNAVGQQAKACKWHIAPHYYQPTGREKEEEHLSSGTSGLTHHHRYHHRHHQQQSLAGSAHHPLLADALSGTLNNCKIIESSNAVVIECRGADDFLAKLPEKDAAQRNPSTTIDRSSASIGSHNSGQLARVNQAEIPTRLTYHVQVFQLMDSSPKPNSSAPKADLNSKLPDTNGAEQHYFPQIDQPAEPGKRVASKAPPTSSTSVSALAEPILVMDTINYTNPIFIVTNLSASTNYLLKIWSSKANIGHTLEQVNITVRTRPIDRTGLADGEHRQLDSMSGTLASILAMGNQKLVMLVALVAFICVIFVALTLTYAIFKIRAIFDVRKARRAVNVNESISALETALCEMRPEKLEADLKPKGHYSMDSYRPYISVDGIVEDCLVVGHQGESCSSTLNRQFADSSLITYPNYLYPSLAAGCSSSNKSGLKLNCVDEESVSTSASNRSMLTNTTESTNGNSNDHHHELRYGKRCFPSSVGTDSNLLFCMESQLGTSSSSNHAFLLPDAYHPFPMQLHIVPETSEELNQLGLAHSVAMVSTPSGDKCAYLPSMETSSQEQQRRMATVHDLTLPFTSAENGVSEEAAGAQSIQTAV